MNIKTALIVLAKLCFVCIAVWLIIRKVDLNHLKKELLEMQVMPFVFACIFANASTITSAMRSKLYFGEYGLPLTRKFSIYLYYIGCFFNVILPGGISGDGYKVFLLWRLKKFSKLRSLRVILYERVNGFYILAFFGLLLYPFTDFFHLLPTLNYLYVISLIAITPCYYFGAKYVLKDKIKIVTQALKYSFLVQIFQLVSAYFILLSLTTIMPSGLLVNFLFLFTVASMVAIVPISVGGAGLRELTFLYGLDLLSHPNLELGVAFGLLNFFITILTALIGLILSLRERSVTSTMEG